VVVISSFEGYAYDAVKKRLHSRCVCVCDLLICVHYINLRVSVCLSLHAGPPLVVVFGGCYSRLKGTPTTH